MPTSNAGGAEEAIATIVPYKNVPALAAYYLGVFALIPCLGAVLALGAVPLGIVGLKRAKASPSSHGTGHAWAGIILGSLVLLGHAAVGLMIWLG